MRKDNSKQDKEVSLFVLFAGIFSLDFKREFRRCCCCLKAKARQEEVASRVLRQHSLFRTRTSTVNNSANNMRHAVVIGNRRYNQDYEQINLKERDNVSSGREESFVSKQYIWQEESACQQTSFATTSIPSDPRQRQVTTADKKHSSNKPKSILRPPASRNGTYSRDAATRAVQKQ